MNDETKFKSAGPTDAPAWVADAIFYQIFPDRFAKSDKVGKPSGLEAWDESPTLRGYKGGDLLGVVEHLDDLADLGINAIYFTPIFTSTANHRYHTHDYFTVDPILGGNAAFDVFLQAAHDRGMKVVLDGVFNHASRGFYQFNHTLENGLESPYIDWFHFDRDRLAKGQGLHAYQPVSDAFDAPKEEVGLAKFGYRAWWDLPELPKFNTDNVEVREFIFSVAEYWIEKGIDGWRLDVPHEIDDDAFWRTFRERVRNKNPEAYLCGEIWGDASRWLKGDIFDGVMNYRLGRATLGVCLKDCLNHGSIATTGLRELPTLTASGFLDLAQEIIGSYRWQNVLAQMNVVSSHDTVRLQTMASGNSDAANLVLQLLVTLPGAPNIYYGDEINMEGERDPDCRRGFPWQTDWRNHPSRSRLRSLLKLRTESKALRRGDLVKRYADEDLMCFDRRIDGESITILANTSSGPIQDIARKVGAVTNSRTLFQSHDFDLISDVIPAKALIVLQIEDG